MVAGITESLLMSQVCMGMTQIVRDIICTSGAYVKMAVISGISVYRL